MILPNKYINLSESLFGFTGYMLPYLKNPIEISDLWDQYQEDYRDKKFPAKHSEEDLSLCVLLLFTLNVIKLNRDGKIEICV